jgi:ATP-dependent protease HslVU (ClpYQ) peptidase subunit
MVYIISEDVLMYNKQWKTPKCIKKRFDIKQVVCDETDVFAIDNNGKVVSSSPKFEKLLKGKDVNFLCAKKSQLYAVSGNYALVIHKDRRCVVACN